MILNRVATVCARFQKLPSDYVSSHDWEDLLLDHKVATVLNEIDQKKEAAQWAALNGGSK